MKATYTIQHDDGSEETITRSVRIQPNEDDRDRALAIVSAIDGAPAHNFEGVRSVTERTVKTDRNGRSKTDLTELWVSSDEVERRAEARRVEGLRWRHQDASDSYLRQVESVRDELRRAADQIDRDLLLLQTSVELPETTYAPSRYDRGLVTIPDAPIRYAADILDKVAGLAGRCQLQYLVQYAHTLEDAAAKHAAA